MRTSMSRFRSRQIILASVAFAVGAGSLLVPETALAAKSLFRIEQSFHVFPNPAVTTPGNAGRYQGFIQPYLSLTMMGAYLYPPGTATVEPGNPIGGAFKLPQGFIEASFTVTNTPRTMWTGYTTVTHSVYYNGPGDFGPNNTHTGPTPTRVVFPTKMGNPYPNFATGDPVTPTTTFDGLYDFSRGGSINVTPGPRRFGGTFRMFYRPEAFFNQDIYYFSPPIYKAYAQFSCLKNGVSCTPGTFVSNISDTTAIYRGTRYLLNVEGTGTGKGKSANTAKATTPRTPGGTRTTPRGKASFVVGIQQYLNMIHPWTTGFASAHNPIGSPNVITPQAQGYDIDLGGADLTVTHLAINQNFNEQLSTLTTTSYTYKQYMSGVRRIVSMVRPRLVHSYRTPLDPVNPINRNWQAARLWAMKVFFLGDPIEVSTYSCVGFEPPMHWAELPLAMGGGAIARRVAKNRVFPFKATLLDEDGNVVTNLVASPLLEVSINPQPSVSIDITEESFPNGKRTSGPEFFRAGGKWHYNLASMGFDDGPDENPDTYTATMISGDPSEYVIDPTCKALFEIE